MYQAENAACGSTSSVFTPLKFQSVVSSDCHRAVRSCWSLCNSSDLLIQPPLCPLCAPCPSFPSSQSVQSGGSGARLWVGVCGQVTPASPVLGRALCAAGPALGLGFHPSRVRLESQLESVSLAPAFYFWPHSPKKRTLLFFSILERWDYKHFFFFNEMYQACKEHG